MNLSVHCASINNISEGMTFVTSVQTKMHGCTFKAILSHMAQLNVENVKECFNGKSRCDTVVVHNL